MLVSGTNTNASLFSILHECSSSDNEVVALEYCLGCVKAKYPLYICMQMEASGNNGTNSFHIQILREAIFVATQARMHLISQYK